jgi:tetratricopeptide (TPR) repeat protein
MLFDLRGRGRRRTVQVIYLGLAILIGAGLVFFGIGGAVGGGLFDAINQNQTADQAAAYKKKIQTAQTEIRADPKNAAAWALLAKSRYQLVGNDTKNVNQATGEFTDQGKAQLASVDAAWQKYLALNPKHPDDAVANLMVNAYGATGLNDPAKAVTAYEVVIAARPPNANLYGNLAILALQAGEQRKAELAENKALALATDKAQKAQLKQQIEQVRQQLAQQAAQQAQQGAQTTTTPALTP